MWCWRCQMEIPMLDEQEYEAVIYLWRNAIPMAKEFKQKQNPPIEKLSFDEIFRPMREKYKEITGFEETNHIAIMHHRISMYGEPCENCGKPLRTPRASFCAACGKTVEKQIVVK
jgi:hypothetical protein